MFYVDCEAGDDAADGSPGAPWRTPSSINLRTLPGFAVVLLKSGCSWDGEVVLGGGDELVLGAFGEGPAPVITATRADRDRGAVTVESPRGTVTGLLIKNTAGPGVTLAGQGSLAEDLWIEDTAFGVRFTGNKTRANRVDARNLHLFTDTPKTENPDDDSGAVAFNVEANDVTVENSSCVECRAKSDDYGYDGGFIELWRAGSGLLAQNNVSYSTQGWIETGGMKGTGDRIEGVRLINNRAAQVHERFWYANPLDEGQYGIPVTNVQISGNLITLTDGASAFAGQTDHVHDDGTNQIGQDVPPPVADPRPHQQDRADQAPQDPQNTPQQRDDAAQPPQDQQPEQQDPGTGQPGATGEPSPSSSTNTPTTTPTSTAASPAASSAAPDPGQPTGPVSSGATPTDTTLTDTASTAAVTGVAASGALLVASETGPGSPDWKVTSGSLFWLVQENAWWTGPASGTGDAASSSEVFRAVTNQRFGDAATSLRFRIDSITSTADTPQVAWDGAHIFLRYQNPQHLYYATIARRDGVAVIKKKCPGGPSNGGTYYDLAARADLGRVTPGQWAQATASSRVNTNGTLTLTLQRDGTMLTATDNGVGCPAITTPGATGLRVDNSQLRFTDFQVAPAPAS